MTYNIFLDNIKIGTSQLEHGDPPMCVVFGTIIFSDATFNFDFFNKYCEDNKIEADTYPDDKLINTTAIPNLKVFNDKGIEIINEGCSISGMDSDVYDITIIGVSDPSYEEEFPHHVKTYTDKFR